MKHYQQLLLLLLLIGFIFPCKGDGTNLQHMTAMADRIILVTFVDRGITRSSIASLTTGYRPSNNYNTSTWSRNVAARLETEYHLKNLAEWPVTELGVQCVVFGVSDNHSMEEILTILAKDPQVELVQRMGIFNTYATQSSIKDPYYNLQTSAQTLQLEQIHRITTGKNVRIALVDTGVELNHPDLVGQILATADYSKGNTEQFSADVHGTAVAGIIAAIKDNDIGIVGVAPNAEIIALKACWIQQGVNQAVCNSFTLALAINKAIKMDVDILNLSLGGPNDPLVERLIDKAIEKGIIVVAADPGSYRPGGRFPASKDNVISVFRSLEQSGGKSLGNSTVIAPGIDILTTTPTATYAFLTGCSFAAAHVSGIAALLLEINHDLTPQDIINLLVTTQKGIDSTAGGIDLLAVINEAQRMAQRRSVLDYLFN
jgi:subtilisin family serine protease